MKKLQLITFVFLLVFPHAHARFVENGQICSRVGKHMTKSCREPKDQSELIAVIEEEKYWNERINLSNRYDSCEFSVFRGWDSEIARLEKKKKSEIKFLELINSERYWAAEDIRKRNVLPSDTVRSAYDTLGAFNPMAEKSQQKLNLYTWCVECAKRSPKSYEDCR